MLAPAAAGLGLELGGVEHLLFLFFPLAAFLLLLLFLVVFHAAIVCLLDASALIPIAQMKPGSSRPTAVTTLR